MKKTNIVCTNLRPTSVLSGVCKIQKKTGHSEKIYELNFGNFSCGLFQ